MSAKRANRQILELMPKLVASIGPISKSQVNEEDGYRFRSIDDIQAALGPILAEHNVSLEVTCSQLQAQRIDRFGVMATLMLDVKWLAPDGSSLTTKMYGHGVDEGDKAVPKAITGAFKSAVQYQLAIASGDKADAEFPRRGESTRPSPEPAHREGQGRADLAEVADLRRALVGVIKNPSAFSSEEWVLLRRRAGQLSDAGRRSIEGELVKATNVWLANRRAREAASS